MVSLASCQEKQGFGLRCGELEKQVCSGQGCGHGHLQVVFPKEGGWRERESCGQGQAPGRRRLGTAETDSWAAEGASMLTCPIVLCGIV